MDRDVDRRRVTGERLVDRVVDDLPHQMVQATLSRRADVHAWALADGFEALEDGDVLGVVAIPRATVSGAVVLRHGASVGWSEVPVTRAGALSRNVVLSVHKNSSVGGRNPS